MMQNTEADDADEEKGNGNANFGGFKTHDYPISGVPIPTRFAADNGVGVPGNAMRSGADRDGNHIRSCHGPEQRGCT